MMALHLHVCINTHVLFIVYNMVLFLFLAHEDVPKMDSEVVSSEQLPSDVCITNEDFKVK